MTDTTKSTNGGVARYVIIGVLVLGAFFGAYRFAAARSANAPFGTAVASADGGLQPASGAPAGSGVAGKSGASGTPACACCGSSAPTAGGVTGDKVVGTAEVVGNVQKISVDLSKGYYEPNQIVLKAGVPAEITFGQSSGCTAQVVSQDLGFSEDLTAGPRTVKLAALQPGEYGFSCGMQMVFGKIVVE
jgi:plastocyanin